MGQYRCQTDGRTYFSDRPCVSNERRGTKLGGYGPQPQQPVHPQRQLPSPGTAEPHVQYLGLRCAEISEGVRTGPSRGVRHDVISELQSEYQQKCGLEDREARKRASEDQAKLRADEVGRRDAVEASRTAATLSSERCTNMHDTIALKRKRESSLNANEVANLRKFEALYNTQCLGR